MIFSGRVYDVLKQLAMLWLPLAGALYFTVAGIWGLPAAEEVVGTIVAVDTFLGGVLHLSTKSYEKNGKYDGTMNVIENAEGAKTVSLELEGDPYELDNKSEVTFKVAKA